MARYRERVDAHGRALTRVVPTVSWRAGGRFTSYAGFDSTPRGKGSSAIAKDTRTGEALVPLILLT